MFKNVPGMDGFTWPNSISTGVLLVAFAMLTSSSLSAVELVDQKNGLPLGSVSASGTVGHVEFSLGDGRALHVAAARLAEWSNDRVTGERTDQTGRQKKTGGKTRGRAKLRRNIRWSWKMK